MNLDANLVRGQLPTPHPTDLYSHHEQGIMLPLSAAFYTNYLLMPMYWTSHDLEK